MMTKKEESMLTQTPRRSELRKSSVSLVPLAKCQALMPATKMPPVVSAASAMWSRATWALALVTSAQKSVR